MSEIVKAGPNKAEYPLHPWMYEELVAWNRGVAAEAAQVATTNRYKNYLSGPFGSWFMNYDAGRAEEPAPAAPEGFDAQMTADGLGFDLVGSGVACGPPAPFKKRVVGPSTPGLLRQGAFAGSGTTTLDLFVGPVTTTVVKADGTAWMRIR